MPATRVVLPVNVLELVSVIVPVPLYVSDPGPERIPLYVVDWPLPPRRKSDGRPVVVGERQILSSFESAQGLAGRGRAHGSSITAVVERAGSDRAVRSQAERAAVDSCIACECAGLGEQSTRRRRF